MMRYFIKICSIMTCFCYSCNSNAICFELEKSLIKSCNSKGINRIYITNDSTSEMYSIVWIDSASAPKIIDLKNIKKGYRIYSGWNNNVVSPYDFKLSSSSIYTIERVQDDAGGYKINVWTDKEGKIIKTSQSDCKN